MFPFLQTCTWLTPACTMYSYHVNMSITLTDLSWMCYCRPESLAIFMFSMEHLFITWSCQTRNKPHAKLYTMNCDEIVIQRSAWIVAALHEFYSPCLVLSRDKYLTEMGAFSWTFVWVLKSKWVIIIHMDVLFLNFLWRPILPRIDFYIIFFLRGFQYFRLYNFIGDYHE